jgi:hypothetical protein
MLEDTPAPVYLSVMTLTLTAAEQKLLVHMLKMASEEFSNHSCNDLDLVKDVNLTPEESLEFRTQLIREGDYPEDTVALYPHTLFDWEVMQYFALKIKRLGGIP